MLLLVYSRGQEGCDAHVGTNPECARDAGIHRHHRKSIHCDSRRTQLALMVLPLRGPEIGIPQCASPRLANFGKRM